MGKREMEHKTVPSFYTKAVDDEQGIVEHIFTVFGVLDAYGDVSHLGSFSKTLVERGHKVRVLDAHQTDSVLNVVGRPVEIREIGRDELPFDVLQTYPEATGGVWAKTQFLMDTPEGKGAYIRIRDGAVDEWSYGFDALDYDFEKVNANGAEGTIRNLRTIRLYEYSIVLWGAVPGTTTLSAKDVDGADDGAGAEMDELTETPEADEAQDVTEVKTEDASTAEPVAIDTPAENDDVAEKETPILSAKGVTQIGGAVSALAKALTDAGIDVPGFNVPADVEDGAELEDEKGNSAPDDQAAIVEDEQDDEKAGPAADAPPTSSNEALLKVIELELATNNLLEVESG